MFCRNCGTQVDHYCHEYMCEVCCKIRTMQKIKILENLHK